MDDTAQISMVTLWESTLELAHADDDVRGMAVFDRYGRRLGEVDDLVVDERERRARLLVISSGGVLGLFESRRLVPVEAIARVDDAVHVDRDHTSLRDLPEDSQRGDPPGDEPQDVPTSRYAAIYRYYGIAPFWSENHFVSYFHQRGA
jgi:sporulation protein YlmC with PRC-barrel domain